MRKYIKKNGNPEKDGMYDTDKGVNVFYKGEWYWYFSTERSWQRQPDESGPEYYFEEVNENDDIIKSIIDPNFTLTDIRNDKD